MLYYELQPIVSSFNKRNGSSLEVRKGMDDFQCHIISRDFGKVLNSLRKYKDNYNIKTILKKYPKFYKEVCDSKFSCPILFAIHENEINEEKDVLFLLKEEDFAFYFDILQDFVLLKAELENKISKIYENFIINNAKSEALGSLLTMDPKKKKKSLIHIYRNRIKVVNKRKKKAIKKAIKEIKVSKDSSISKRIIAEQNNLIKKVTLEGNKKIEMITLFSSIVDDCILFFENMFDTKDNLQELIKLL